MNKTTVNTNELISMQVRLLHMLLGLTIAIVMFIANDFVATEVQAAPTVIDKPLQQHQWQASKSDVQNAQYHSDDAHFTNIKSGDKLTMPFTVKFGLGSNWGLALVNKPIDKTNELGSANKAEVNPLAKSHHGHHHLLIDEDLPVDFKTPIPATPKHLHFGKGQMETVLNLSPGVHRLRLLFADSAHLPHFVYSKEITVTALAPSSPNVVPLVAPDVEILNIKNNAVVEAPFLVQMHANNAVKQGKNTHFRLTVLAEKGIAKSKNVPFDFKHQQTEVWLKPPQGSYTAQLALVEDDTGAMLGISKTILFVVR